MCQARLGSSGNVEAARSGERRPRRTAQPGDAWGASTLIAIAAAIAPERRLKSCWIRSSLIDSKRSPRGMRAVRCR